MDDEYSPCLDSSDGDNDLENCVGMGDRNQDGHSNASSSISRESSLPESLVKGNNFVSDDHFYNIQSNHARKSIIQPASEPEYLRTSRSVWLTKRGKEIDALESIRLQRIVGEIESKYRAKIDDLQAQLQLKKDGLRNLVR